MKRTLLFIATVLIGLFTTFSYIPVFAAEDTINATDAEGVTYTFPKGGCIKTSILAKYDTDGDGELDSACGNNTGSVIIDAILIPVMDILTVGIGIIGAIGITIVGVQYMTAGDNEEQTRKAKRRMFEIVIGIAVYVLAYALLKWLLPGFN